MSSRASAIFCSHESVSATTWEMWHFSWQVAKTGRDMRSYGGYVETLNWTKGNLDTSSYWAFLRAASPLVDPVEAFGSVAAPIRAAGGQLRMGKLRHQLQDAQAHIQAHGGQLVAASSPVLWAPLLPKPAIDHKAVNIVASRVKIEITPE